MPEPGGPPPIFFRSFNPIGTGEGRLSPPITTGPPNIFHLPASINRNELKLPISAHMSDFVRPLALPFPFFLADVIIEWFLT